MIYQTAIQQIWWRKSTHKGLDYVSPSRRNQSFTYVPMQWYLIWFNLTKRVSMKCRFKSMPTNNPTRDVSIANVAAAWLVKFDYINILILLSTPTSSSLPRLVLKSQDTYCIPTVAAMSMLGISIPSMHPTQNKQASTFPTMSRS